MQPIENLIAAYNASNPGLSEERPIVKREDIFRRINPEPLESAYGAIPTSPSPEDEAIAIETYLETEREGINVTLNS